ncbi:hypothetical protein ACFSKN_12405 [Mariniflexile gromovii]|uniref:Parallel beta helix pectate lyase-like protein n=1 Tax=Mariniflexile gromovii TaxID=362523 RepID=A0ABS4BUZ7_9FLAO|nr:hypothetical protein [Mariniflexile gromovii]MBP0904410.1 hypothetical protein [Mariniflexile gromovii]
MKTIILNFTFLLCSATLIAQTTWTVDNRPGTTAQFSSVQAAHDAAQSGDFIYVHPSPNSYGVLSIKKTIHLRGIGHSPELANGDHASMQSITLSRNTTEATSSSNSTISGLEIGVIQDGNEAAFSNILIQNNRINNLNFYQVYNFIIQGNVFNTTSAYSIIFNTPSHANNIISHNIFNTISNTSPTLAVLNSLVASDTVSNNLFIMNFNGATNTFFNNCNNPTVNNNMFVLGAAAVISSINTNNSTINFQNCLTFDYGGQSISALNGTTNLNNTNPQFVNIGTPTNPDFAYTKSYKLQVGSPAIASGSDGSDLGIYGQGFLFQMKGYPFDLPYPTSININNAVVEAGGNLEVVFKANANVEN